MLLHWIWLAHRPDVSERMKICLLEHFQDPEDIYFADGESYRHVEGITAAAAESLKDKDLSSAGLFRRNVFNTVWRILCLYGVSHLRLHHRRTRCARCCGKSEVMI